VNALSPRHSVGARTPGADDLERSVGYVAGRPEVLRCVEVAGARAALSTRLLVPSIAVTAEDIEEGGAARPSTRPLVLVHSGSRDTRRSWPTERFAAVAATLHGRHGCDVAVVGAERDAAAARAVVGASEGAAFDLTGRLSLGDLLGLASRSVLFVGNDSGPRHIIAAAGTPTVGLFLMRNVLAFGPLVGDAHRAVISSTDRCPICRAPGDVRCSHLTSWLGDITVDDVLGTCDDLLGAACDSHRRASTPRRTNVR
jgi:ADP-heptose:LPS heptosyltransferase